MYRGTFFLGGTGGGQKWQKLKSILMITRVGFGRTELSSMLSYTECCALSSGPGEMVLKGFRKPWIFMICWGSKIGKTWKFRMNMVRFGFPELSTLAKWSPKKSWKFPGVFSLKNPIFKGFIEKVRGPGGRKFLVHCGNSMNSPYKRLGPILNQNILVGE